MDRPGSALEEITARLGVTPEEIAGWASLGLLRMKPDGRFDADATERIRLLRFITDRGIATSEVTRLSDAEGDALGRWIDFLGGARGLGRSVEEAVGEIGIPEALLRRLSTAAGLGPEPEIFDEDVEMMRAVMVALSVGLPEEALVQLVRVFADALGRVADAANRLFHFYVHERLRAQGLAGQELVDATSAASGPLAELIEPTILYFYRRAWDRTVREDLTLHLAEDLAPPGEAVAALPVAVLFVDLASFTPLTEAMGDAAAAEVLDRFSDLVREAAGRHDGRVLKQIGDEFMLVFASSEAAVRCGLGIAASVAREPQFPDIRMGAHAGEAVYREADYLGTSVNTAARVASAAERGQFLVSDAVRPGAGGIRGVTWHPVGPRRLKGLSEPLDLYEVRGSDQQGPRVADPVVS